MDNKIREQRLRSLKVLDDFEYDIDDELPIEDRDEFADYDYTDDQYYRELPDAKVKDGVIFTPHDTVGRQVSRFHRDKRVKDNHVIVFELVGLHLFSFCDSPWNPRHFSIYKNILVQWDYDYDTRVLQFIDELPTVVRNNLVAVAERKGGLGLAWKTVPPKDFMEHGDVEVGGDCWNICESFSHHEPTLLGWNENPL